MNSSLTCCYHYKKIKKKTPGNGFAIMKCKEKLAELNKIFDDIDYGVQITHD